MARRRKKAAAPRSPESLKPRAAERPPRPPLPRAKLWGFRLAAVVLAPTLFFLLLELVLRVAGFGYPTSFLLPSVVNGRQVFVQNNRFGWRFFGPNYSRRPTPFAIPRVKPPDTVRVFVFGGSAAYGDPQPEFGLPRMLQALLDLRYPGVHFEVIDAAMTAINSHTVLPIARDCEGAGGDIWVVYMGNNEVVGPFGAGTVFGPQAPGMALIRASLALKTTRTGQFLDWLLQKIHPPPASKSEWGGMLMFLGNQVRADDPRMTAVYDHFRQNLRDILKAGRASGAGIVVSTVAVNLKDCAPFGSEFRPGLDASAKTNFMSLVRAGRDAEAAGHNEEALGLFRKAEQIDDSVADLQFMMAQTCLALGHKAEAHRRFARARNLDTLRFRCDSKLNDIIREVASGRESDRILLADADKVFDEDSGGLPGAKYFYEHVHLTFEGNYLLARTLADQLVKLLPGDVRGRVASGAGWPSIEECARRLAWTDWQRLEALSQMLGRLSDPPFTAELDHAEQVRRLTRQIEQLRPHAQAAARKAEALCRQALAATPNDPVLLVQLARFQELHGEPAAAAESARRATELLPNDADCWVLYGRALMEQKEYEDAAQAFQSGFREDPLDFWILQDLAHAYVRLGRTNKAMAAYRQAIAIKPRFGMAYLGLGQLLEAAGRKEEAEQNYRLALKNRIHRTTELTTLAEFCQSRGWFEAAVTNFLDAIRLSPAEPVLYVRAGLCFDALQKSQEALQCYANAVRLAPEFGQARFLLGLEYGRQGKPEDAVRQFREAVRLMPDVVEARLNLGIGLQNLGRKSEAIEQFREVLRRSPTNAIALRKLEQLQAPAAPARPEPAAKQ